jgi:hypothetical protein
VKRKIENPIYRVANLVNKELKIQEKVSFQLLAQTRGHCVQKKWNHDGCGKQCDG